MRMLRVIEFLSLDGVMQAPAYPDEDTEGGFRHGGWQRPYFDDVLGKRRRGHGCHRRVSLRAKDLREDGGVLADCSRRRSLREAPEQRAEVRRFENAARRPLAEL